MSVHIDNTESVLPQVEGWFTHDYPDFYELSNGKYQTNKNGKRDTSEEGSPVFHVVVAVPNYRRDPGYNHLPIFPHISVQSGKALDDETKTLMNSLQNELCNISSYVSRTEQSYLQYLMKVKQGWPAVSMIGHSNVEQKLRMLTSEPESDFDGWNVKTKIDDIRGRRSGNDESNLLSQAELRELRNTDSTIAHYYPDEELYLWTEPFKNKPHRVTAWPELGVALARQNPVVFDQGISHIDCDDKNLETLAKLKESEMLQAFSAEHENLNRYTNLEYRKNGNDVRTWSEAITTLEEMGKKCLLRSDPSFKEPGTGLQEGSRTFLSWRNPSHYPASDPSTSQRTWDHEKPVDKYLATWQSVYFCMMTMMTELQIDETCVIDGHAQYLSYACYSMNVMNNSRYLRYTIQSLYRSLEALDSCRKLVQMASHHV